jgi:hypothetical protein
MQMAAAQTELWHLHPCTVSGMQSATDGFEVFAPPRCWPTAGGDWYLELAHGFSAALVASTASIKNRPAMPPGLHASHQLRLLLQR